jgi:uncharacterized protein YjlB
LRLPTDSRSNRNTVAASVENTHLAFQLGTTEFLTMEKTPAASAIQALTLDSNLGIPNNPGLPVLIYPGAMDATDDDPAEAFEALFSANGWPPQWRYGVYDYHHYHTRGHEVLGVYAGHARLMLGGPNGHVIEVTAGDALLLPAGTGHCNLESSDDFAVVGAYPPGQQGDINREPATAAQIEQIAHLGFPASDPVIGKRGGVVEHWRR